MADKPYQVIDMDCPVCGYRDWATLNTKIDPATQLSYLQNFICVPCRKNRQIYQKMDSYIKHYNPGSGR